MDNALALLPEIVLVVGALFLLLVDAASPSTESRHLPVISMVALLVAGLAAVGQWNQEPHSALAQMVVTDRFGVVARLIVLAAGVLTTLMAPAHLARKGLARAEFYALLLLSTAGMTMLVVSSDLIMVFLSIELLSLALYVMAGFERSKLESQEASMKYFLLGAFASAFLLYGIAFVFGGAGTTNLLRLREILASGGLESFMPLTIAVGLIIVGLGFKAAMVPFHMWTPDVYQGAPTSVTAFMAGGTKAAAFAAIVRIFIGSMPQLQWDWRPVVAVLSALTMVVGAVVAVAQTDVKRMLAYSSITHAGFLGLGVVAGGRTGAGAVLMYLAIYTAMTIGSFACIQLFRDGDDERTHLHKYAGLGTVRPFAAALFAFFLFSLAGIPPLGGFWAKWDVFYAVLGAGYGWLAIVGVLSSVISAFFYIRIVVVMFMQDPASGDEMPLWESAGLRTALAICAIAIVAVSVAPGWLLDLATKAARFA